MAQLIKHGTAAVDTWKTLEIAEGETPESVALPTGDVIFPFAVWQARKTEIISCHKRIGLLIRSRLLHRHRRQFPEIRRWPRLLDGQPAPPALQVSG